MKDPLKSEHLKHLQAEAVEQFDQAGYLSPVSIISEVQANIYRARLEAYELELGHPVQGPLRTKPHLLFKWVDDLMRNKAILDCIEDLIGPDILCWNSWFWIKESNSTSYVSWHQDSQYWVSIPASWSPPGWRFHPRVKKAVVCRWCRVLIVKNRWPTKTFIIRTTC